MKARTAAATLFALALSATVAVAQNAGPSGPPPGGPPAGAPGGAGGAPVTGQGMGRGMGGARRMQAMMEGITLSAEQQARVDSIVARYAAQMPAFTPGAAPDPQAMQTRRELSQRQDAEIRALLTAEQQAIWDRNAENMRANMRRPGN